MDLQQQPNTLALPEWSLFRRLFWRLDILPFSPNLENYRVALREDLSNIIPHHTDASINDDTLVIHMRSGDVFTDKLNAVKMIYIQPPLSYYLEIISNFSFKDIVIVTQNDHKNPCINNLKKIIPNIRVQSSTLFDDISTIMSARNLVVPHSSFSICLGLASDKLKRIFIPQFDVIDKVYYMRAPVWPNIHRCAFMAGQSNSFFLKK
jgi:hypothetical protein